MILVGAKAPEIQLITTELKQITWQDYAGKNVVLLFFPLAYTSTCTKEMCETQNDLAIYQELQAEVIGISVDSPFVLKKYREEYNLQFIIASDFNRYTINQYQIAFDGNFSGMTGFSRRAAFVVDKNQIIKYTELITTPGVLPDFNAIKAALKALS
jgi:glutaredoxin-dependent peroxiredoxin